MAFIVISDDAMKAVDNVVINKYKNFTTHNTQYWQDSKVQVRNEASFHPASDQWVVVVYQYNDDYNIWKVAN